MDVNKKKLYVGNLPYKTTKEELEQLFSQFGTVTDVHLVIDKMSGRSKGFAFVEMNTEEEAKAAAEKLDGHELDGRALKVNEARPPKPRTDFQPRQY